MAWEVLGKEGKGWESEGLGKHSRESRGLRLDQLQGLGFDHKGSARSQGRRSWVSRAPIPSWARTLRRFHSRAPPLPEPQLLLPGFLETRQHQNGFCRSLIKPLLRLLIKQNISSAGHPSPGGCAPWGGKKKGASGQMWSEEIDGSGYSWKINRRLSMKKQEKRIRRAPRAAPLFKVGEVNLEGSPSGSVN